MRDIVQVGDNANLMGNSLYKTLETKIMMEKTHIIILSIVMSFMATGLFSQESIDFHFGPSFPIADFADDDFNNESAGGASMGVSLGFQYLFPINQNGLGIFLGVDGSYNSLRESVRDNIDRFYEENGLGNAEITYYRYINIPISAGLSYIIPSDENTTAFFRAGVVSNFFKITNHEIKVGTDKLTMEFDWANQFGFRFGGGALINENISITLDYYGLGEHSTKGIVEFNGVPDPEDVDIKQKVSLIIIALGFRF